MDVFLNNLGFEALEHLDALFGYALALTRDLTEAEDLVQETYLRATTASHRPDADSNLKGWLFVIMRNAWLNQVRHKNNGPRFVELETGEEAVDDTQENPHVVYLRKLEREQVREAIESLPDAYREIVVLRDIEGMSTSEVAQMLCSSETTVRSQISRARVRMKDVIDQMIGGQP